MPSDGLASSTLIGRERELAALRAAVDGTGERGRIVLVEGEAGVGKTALLGVLAAEAAAGGAMVLRARGGELERGEGFGIARRLLERVVADAVDSGRPGLLDGAADHALGVFGHGEMLLDEGARYGLYWLVANLAEAGPLTLVVDDAQWADVASLDWLAYLARRLEDLPVLLALGVRTGDPGAGATALEAIRAEPGAEALRPASLDADGTAALAARLWDRPVGADFAAACHTWTGGNPHFVNEVVAGLRADDQAPEGGAVEWMRSRPPERLATLTRRRLARLSPAAVALAGAVAVLAGGGRLDRAAALARFGPDPGAADGSGEPADIRGLDPDAAAAAADELAAARILAPAGDALAFVHPLVAAAVYEDLPAARRGADHRRAAALLTRRAVRPRRSPPSSCGRRPPATNGRSTGCCAAAGEALAHGSAASAVELLTRARSEPPPPARAVQVLGMLGMAEALEAASGGLAPTWRRRRRSAKTPARAPAWRSPRPASA